MDTFNILRIVLFSFWLLVAVGAAALSLFLAHPSSWPGLTKNQVLIRVVAVMLGGFAMGGFAMWFLVYEPRFLFVVAWLTLVAFLILALLFLWEYVVRKRAWAVATVTILAIVIVVLVVVAVITTLPLL